MASVSYIIVVFISIVVLIAATPAQLIFDGDLPIPDGPVVKEYHVPVGIPEAARIEANERSVNVTDERPAGYIVGGLASYNGEHPFMTGLIVSLTTGGTSVCGGTLVTQARVLTAASCYWDGVSNVNSILVVLGSVTLFSGGTRVYGTRIVMHGSYNPGSLRHDIALLTIPYQGVTSYVKPIAYLAYGSEQYAGYRAEVVGYGRTSDSAPITTSASLRDVFVDVISNSACVQVYGAVVTADMVCSSGAGGRSPCGGDYGGPLILYSSAGADVLIGVFTFTSTSGCSASDPAGYMRVSNYYSWIEANIDQ